MKIDIGCGHIREDGFDIYADVIPYPHVNLVTNCEKLNFPNNTFDFLRANDVAEHFPKNKIKKVIGEWVRVVKINGNILIRVPDIDKLVNGYLNNKINIDFFLRRIYGGQNTPNNLIIKSELGYDPNTHLCGFTQQLLQEIFESFGCKFNQRLYNVCQYNMSLEFIKLK